MENKQLGQKADRLNFQHLREKGNRVQPCGWLVVYWDKNNLGKPRILWNLSRKVGNSVTRNRLKRWCREFLRVKLADVFLSQGLDLNLCFRPLQKDFYKDLRREAIDKELDRIERKIRSTLGKNA